MKTTMATSGLEATLRRRWIIWTSLVLVYIIGYFHRVERFPLALSYVLCVDLGAALFRGWRKTHF